jgi:hypothetical protein
MCAKLLAAGQAAASLPPINAVTTCNRFPPVVLQNDSRPADARDGAHLSVSRANIRIPADQTNDLGTRQEDRPIPVRRVHARRPSEIERIVLAETRADAGVLDLASRIHFRRHAVPATHHGTVASCGSASPC